MILFTVLMALGTLLLLGVSAMTTTEWTPRRDRFAMALLWSGASLWIVGVLYGLLAVA